MFDMRTKRKNALTDIEPAFHAAVKLQSWSTAVVDGDALDYLSTREMDVFWDNEDILLLRDILLFVSEKT
ncbi:hypothetical protein VF21_05964 [Pseudogymnoascus sp. 05NY08]|nr:hypothetical protein VF21_05964 [Pseudogymnoascus sp. 05NY08]